MQALWSIVFQAAWLVLNMTSVGLFYAYNRYKHVYNTHLDLRMT